MNNYERFLTRITDDVFDRAYMEGLTWIGLAHKSGLSINTVYNLGNRITRFPQLRTLYLLAQAVDMNIVTLRKEVRREAQKAQVQTALNY
jgi:hypothetical protein